MRMNGRKSSRKEYIFARYLYSMFGTVVGVGHWAPLPEQPRQGDVVYCVNLTFIIGHNTLSKN